jgi:hypothetical protein
VLERLEQREAQARRVVEQLQVEAEAVAGRLAAASEPWSRLVIAREAVAEVPPDLPAAGATAGAGVRGVVRDVAVYARIRQVFEQAEGPLRAKAVCERLGLVPLDYTNLAPGLRLSRSTMQLRDIRW